MACWTSSYRGILFVCAAFSLKRSTLKLALFSRCVLEGKGIFNEVLHFKTSKKKSNRTNKRKVKCFKSNYNKNKAVETNKCEEYNL